MLFHRFWYFWKTLYYCVEKPFQSLRNVSVSKGRKRISGLLEGSFSIPAVDATIVLPTVWHCTRIWFTSGVLCQWLPIIQCTTLKFQYLNVDFYDEYLLYECAIKDLKRNRGSGCLITVYLRSYRPFVKKICNKLSIKFISWRKSISFSLLY